jgi:hypothetical protein
MIAFPSSVSVWLAVGRTDMRRYAEHRIMRSPWQRCEHRRGFAGNTLSIILRIARLLQHCDELVWWSEFSGA